MQKEKEQTFSDKEKSPSLWQREGTEGRECQYERLKPTLQAAQEKRLLPATDDIYTQKNRAPIGLGLKRRLPTLPPK